MRVNFNVVSLFYLNKVSVYAHVALNVYIKDLKPKCVIDVWFLFDYTVCVDMNPSCSGVSKQ